MKTKQLLILALVLTFGFSAFSQKRVQVNNKVLKQIKMDPVGIQNNNSTPVDYDYNNSSKDRDIEKVVIGGSGNIYGYLFSVSTPLNYNPEANQLSFGFRADPALYGDAQGSGTIMGAGSEDFGTTWSDPCYIVNTENEGYYNRFPNSDVANMDGTYNCVAGPTHDGGEWLWTYTGSSMFNCENTNYQYLDYDNSYGTGLGTYFAGTGLTVCDDDLAHYLYVKTEGFSTTSMALTDVVGEWDTDHFVYDEGESAEVEMTLDADGNFTWRGTWTGGDNGFGSCFSEDGQIGYMWAVGQADGAEYGGYQPIIFRTDDGGSSWDNIEFDFRDFEDILVDYIYETNEGDIMPACHETDGLVDANGNLQMIAIAASHSSSYSDSLGWGWLGDYGHVFNFEVTPDGLNKVIWIDSVRTDVVADADENALGAQGWNHRLGICKDPTEQYFAFMWTDTWDEAYEVNARPDIFGNARHMDDDAMFYNETQAFTYGGDVTPGFYFYAFTSPMGFADGNNFVVPMSQTLTPPEYFGDDDTAPCTIHYVKGISFENLISGIDENAAISNLHMSQNIPNPASGNTSINFTSNEVSNINLSISNIMGQEIYKHNYGTFNAGSNNIEFNVDQWDAGVYFYTLSNGDQTITKKMIVE